MIMGEKEEEENIVLCGRRRMRTRAWDCVGEDGRGLLWVEEEEEEEEEEGVAY